MACGRILEPMDFLCSSCLLKLKSQKSSEPCTRSKELNFKTFSLFSSHLTKKFFLEDFLKKFQKYPASPLCKFLALEMTSHFKISQDPNLILINLISKKAPVSHLIYELGLILEAPILNLEICEFKKNKDIKIFLKYKTPVFVEIYFSHSSIQVFQILGQPCSFLSWSLLTRPHFKNSKFEKETLP